MVESLHDLFKKIIAEYADVYKDVWKTNDFKNPFRNLFDEDIPQAIRNIPEIDTNTYSIKGSYGVGRWTEVPYIVVCNRNVTTSASRGVYVVYLLNKDEHALYLTFGIAVTEILKHLKKMEDADANKLMSLSKLNSPKAMETLREFSGEIRARLGNIDFQTDDQIHSGKEAYDAGTICYKKYTLDNLPSDDVLKRDLLSFLAIYEKYYEEIYLPENKDKPKLSHKIEVHKLLPFTLSSLPPSFQSSFSIRFITSLLAKPFVILTGNSGTGKTRIAKGFAEYLEVTDENDKKNWELVAVGADWTDNTEVMGFYDPLGGEKGKGIYRKSRILELLERANAHPDVPYFLILDEMNLSHVERYFSDFLSHMETEGNPFVLDGYEGSVVYPSNLFVVGTVNMDETTYMFSPKVLDRANVIEFKPAMEDVLGLFKTGAKVENAGVAPQGLAEGFLELALKVRKDELVDGLDYDKIEEVFRAVYEKTDEAGFAFAYRTVKEICRYVAAAYELAELTVAEFNGQKLMDVVDEQLFQKVLPKIYGNKKEIGPMLGDLQMICDSNGLTLCGAKVKAMKGKLDKAQFASFM